jgi:hypothetical protein
MASGYDRSPPPPPRPVTRPSWRRSEPLSWEPSRRSAPLDLASAVTRVKRERDVSSVAPDIGVLVAKGVVVKHDPDDVSNKRTKSEEHEDDTTAQAATSSSLPVVDENKHREEWRKKYNIPPPPLAPPSAYVGQTLPARRNNTAAIYSW